MKEILQTIIENLVEDKNAISINEVEGEKSIVFEVKVSENDMGRVIGKQGKIAGAIRTIMKSVSAREHKKVSVEFLG